MEVSPVRLAAEAMPVALAVSEMLFSAPDGQRNTVKVKVADCFRYCLAKYSIPFPSTAEYARPDADGNGLRLLAEAASVGSAGVEKAVEGAESFPDAEDDGTWTAADAGEAEGDEEDDTASPRQRSLRPRHSHPPSPSPSVNTGAVRSSPRRVPASTELRPQSGSRKRKSPPTAARSTSKRSKSHADGTGPASSEGQSQEQAARRVHPDVAPAETIDGIHAAAMSQILKDPDRNNPTSIGSAETTLKHLILLFGRTFGDDGRDNLSRMIEALQFHKVNAERQGHLLTQSPRRASDDPIDDLVSAYTQHARFTASVHIDQCSRSIALSEFSRLFDDLVASLNQRDKPRNPRQIAVANTVMQTLKDLGYEYKGKRHDTMATDFMLYRLHGVHPCSAQSDVSKPLRKRLHDDVSNGRLYNQLEKTFGVGIFVLLPTSRSTLFRGCTQQDIKAVADAFAQQISWARAICGAIETLLIRPLLVEGKNGADVVREARAWWDTKSLKSLTELPSIEATPSGTPANA